MRGIEERRLIEKFLLTCQPSYKDILGELIDECHELQESWISLEEFLKSGFQGLCWMLTIYGDVVTAKFFDDKFILVNTGVCAPFKFITHVMPIHRPEPPK